MRRYPIVLLALTAFVLAAVYLLASSVLAIMIVKAHAVRVERGNDLYGPVIVTVAGRDEKIADESSAAWLINGGRTVVYTGKDGAGGYENEGQSLYSFDLSMGRKSKLFAEVYHITKVAEVKSSSGRSLLLISMTDGGLGAPHAAIARSSGGLVWRSSFARFVRAANGRLVVQLLAREEAPNGNWRRAKVVRTVVLDLDELSRRKTLKVLEQRNSPNP